LLCAIVQAELDQAGSGWPSPQGSQAAPYPHLGEH
jgi:hypothetical protein